MSRLLHYNPENDLALASNALSYTPTAAAQEIRRSGALLPLWWSEPGDEVIVTPNLMPAAEALCEKWHLPGKPVVTTTASCAMPWGWSRSTLREFRSMGLENLPSDEQVQAIRDLSHRRTSITLLKSLGISPDMLPLQFSDADAAIAAVSSMGNCVLKMPWSGSGRGVFHSNHISRTMLEKTVRDVVHRQGSIIVEHELKKERDFATLFYSDGQNISYRGLSLFITDSHGHYQGNMLMPQVQLAEFLGVEIAPIATAVAEKLTSIIAPMYQGWLGVDMMLYKDASGDTAVWPCVEINLRMTMGVLALYVAKRVTNYGNNGLLTVSKNGRFPDGINLSPTSGKVQFTVQPAR